MYEVSVTKEFCSAHFLRGYEGKCGNLHGHTWKVEISFRSAQLAKNGILVDFMDIGAVLDTLLEPIDHGVINDIPPFDTLNPTSENLARWFYTEMTNHLADKDLKPHCVRIWEASDACASYWEEDSCA